MAVATEPAICTERDIRVVAYNAVCWSHIHMIAAVHRNGIRLGGDPALKGFVLMKFQPHCQVMIQMIKQTAEMHRLTEYQDAHAH